jgi:hypothetical protein
MKLIYALFIFIIISCSGKIEKNEKLINYLNNEKSETRGNLIEISKSEFRLDYYDVYEKDTHLKFLESKGYQGGGPSWLGIIYGAIKMSEPEIINGIRFDDEADGLAIWSSDKTKLEKIGRLISIVKSDNEILMKTIEVAEKNWKME